MQRGPYYIRNMKDEELVKFEASTNETFTTAYSLIPFTIILAILFVVIDIAFWKVVLFLACALFAVTTIMNLRFAIADKKLFPTADQEIVRRGIEHKVKELGTPAATRHYVRLQKIKEEQLYQADKDFKMGVWPFSSDAFYQRCERNNIKSIDTPFAEQKAKAIAKSMLLDAGISDKCITEFLTLSRIQKLFDEAVANIQRATAEKERQRKLEEERKRTTPVQSRFYGADQRNFELAKKLAKMYGAAKRKAMLEAQMEAKAKELEALENRLAALRDADENKYKNAALIQTIVPQEDKKDWAVAGGIAHGLGGAAIGAAVAIDTMRENAEIEARNQARKAQHADLARQIINKDYKAERKEVYEEIKQLETIVKPMREEIALVGDKIVFDGTSTAALSKQIEITNQQVAQHNGHLEVSFFIENNCSTNVTYDVEIVLDGTATAKIYSGEVYVGTAIVVLPVYGIAQGQRCRVSGLSTHYLEGKHDYRIEVNFNNLWLMEK